MIRRSRILIGDALDWLPRMPAESIHCCVTSPPYWDLRDYGHEKQIGNEETPEEYTANIVKVCAGVKRVLRDDGTFWLNIGDTYKGKQLTGIPWMVAFALKADGWYLRSDIIWAKPNPLPESVEKRCTRSHEYVFMLAKNGDHYFDRLAIAEPAKYAGHAQRYSYESAKARNKGREPSGNGARNAPPAICPEDRNKRDVWWVSVKRYSGSHFATFPSKLIEPCILAGSPRGGVVLDPFFGAGTTGVVALKLDRLYVGIELNPDYAEMARQRIARSPGAGFGLLG